MNQLAYQQHKDLLTKNVNQSFQSTTSGSTITLTPLGMALLENQQDLVMVL